MPLSSTAEHHFLDIRAAVRVRDLAEIVTQNSGKGRARVPNQDALPMLARASFLSMSVLQVAVTKTSVGLQRNDNQEP